MNEEEAENKKRILFYQSIKTKMKLMIFGVYSMLS